MVIVVLMVMVIREVVESHGRTVIEQRLWWERVTVIVLDSIGKDEGECMCNSKTAALFTHSCLLGCNENPTKSILHRTSTFVMLYFDIL
jgi:hypothetical protein